MTTDTQTGLMFPLKFSEESPMASVVLEPESEARLRGFQGVVEVFDHCGKRMGFFHPTKTVESSTPLREMSPFTDEEILARCGQTEGQPLADILQDLRRR